MRYVTVNQGEITAMHVGMSGTMSVMMIEEGARKTRRGLEGVVRSGRSAGGLSYGYAVRREYDAKGEPIRGLREIVSAGPFQRQADRPAASTFQLRTAVVRYFASFRTQDFSLAFAARALMFFSIYGINGYTFYTLQDRVGAANRKGATRRRQAANRAT